VLAADTPTATPPRGSRACQAPVAAVDACLREHNLPLEQCAELAAFTMGRLAHETSNDNARCVHDALVTAISPDYAPDTAFLLSLGFLLHHARDAAPALAVMDVDEAPGTSDETMHAQARRASLEAVFQDQMVALYANADAQGDLAHTLLRCAEVLEMVARMRFSAHSANAAAARAQRAQSVTWTWEKRSRALLPRVRALADALLRKQSGGGDADAAAYETRAAALLARIDASPAHAERIRQLLATPPNDAAAAAAAAAAARSMRVSGLLRRAGKLTALALLCYVVMRVFEWLERQRQWRTRSAAARRRRPPAAAARSRAD
jgi:hypothetical protein